MRIVKTCLYRTLNYNLLPTVLLSPLYSVVKGWPVFMAHAPHAASTRPAYWSRAGFRLAFKFACFHAGIEVHYHTTEDK